MTDLDARAIEQALALRGAALGRPLSVVERTGSTNDDAKRAAAAGAPHGATFVADAQSAGRGRGDHTWHSPPGENLYLSVVLRPRIPPASVSPVALVVGLSVAAALEPRAGSCGLSLKWPNDVLAGGRKLAGVLIEGQLRGGALGSLVVGVGVNVRTAEFPPLLAGRATSLALLGCRDLDRASLLADLLAAINAGVERYEQGGLAPFAGELALRDALRGRRVEIGGLRGVAEGIDPEGRLRVRAGDHALHAITAGEVMLAPLDDPPCASPQAGARLRAP